MAEQGGVRCRLRAPPLIRGFAPVQHLWHSSGRISAGGRDDDGAETASAEIFRPLVPDRLCRPVGRSVFRVAQDPLSAGEGGLRRGNPTGGASAPMAWAMRLCAAPLTAPLSVAPDDLAARRISVRDRSDRADACGEVLCRFADRDRVDLEGDGKTLLRTDSTRVRSLQGLPARKRG